MLEWVCPQCSRAVDPAFQICPFCDKSEATAGEARPARTRHQFAWADIERGFRFGLGFVAAVAVAYFVLFLVAYFRGHEGLVDRLAGWLRWR